MSIENNLPVILDVATTTEDGLMSYQDKAKLDSIGDILNNKLDRDSKITSAQLDISSDAVKIQPENLSEEVKKMMTGQTSVNASVTKNSVTREHIVDNSITISELDKRIFLANIVSTRPINFMFDTKKVSINIPKGTLLLTDAITDRPLVTGSDIEDKIYDVTYPTTDHDGLNFIVSSATGGTLSMINHRVANSIPNTSSIVAMVTLSKTYEASVIMNGNYTINGLVNGTGTESAALMGSGKIVFDSQTGYIDFTNAGDLHLILNGIYNRTITVNSIIRLADYTEDSIYTLYWDGATSSLKVEASATGSADIFKIALIKDGKMIPFVNTGIYYSKPYMEAPYFNEELNQIDNIYISSDSPVSILNEVEHKIQFSEDTFVCFNGQALQIANEECYYEDREGLHYILFNLDTNEVTTRFYKDAEDTSVRNIVIGTIWHGNGYVIPSGGFEFTVDGKAPYKEDLTTAEENIKQLQDIVISDLVDNKILVGDELYMIEGEELPIYASSMLVETVEGIKPAIVYNKNNDEMKPRVEFFNEQVLINDTIGDKVSLLAYDKYNSQSYLKNEVSIKKVASDSKMGQDVKILCLGDDLINDKTAYHVRNMLTSLGVNAEMLGTMANSEVSGEGRTGWFYSTFVGASGRGLEEGKINVPPGKVDKSTIHINPFIRAANADDKANYPNECFRADGEYIEKTYYNDNNKDGAFYIFDFANYMEVQGIETPDVVVIALKPEAVNRFTEDVVSVNMMYMKQMISGIREALPNTHIAIIPQYGACTVYEDMWNITSEMITETSKYVASLEDDKIKVVPAWLHMNREFGTKYTPNFKNADLYEEYVYDQSNDKLTDIAKIELANSIVSFIMNI